MASKKAKAKKPVKARAKPKPAAGKAVEFKARLVAGKPESDPIYVDAAFINHIQDNDLFFIDFGAAPNPLHLDPKLITPNTKQVEAINVAALKCHSSFIPKLISALHENYQKYLLAKKKADEDPK